jgi:hypothetical protein
MDDQPFEGEGNYDFPWMLHGLNAIRREEDGVVDLIFDESAMDLKVMLSEKEILFLADQIRKD